MRRSGKGSGGAPEWWQAQRNISRAMAGALEDARHGISQSASMIPPQRETPRAASGGTVPLSPPAGIEHVDRIAESFARQDQITAMRQANENAWIEQQFTRGHDPCQAKINYDPLKAYDDSVPSFHREKK